MSKVRVFSTPTCPYCHQAKEFLKEEEIAFDDIDVTKDHAAAKEMIEKTQQNGVPVIDVDGEFVVGFNQEQLEELLEKKKIK